MTDAVKETKTKKPIYKRRWFIVLAVLFVLGAIGGASAPKPSASNGDGAKKEQAAKEEKTEFAVGETCNFDGVDYTVNKFEVIHPEYSGAKKGEEVCAVSLTIKNNSDKQIRYSEFDWKIDADGAINDRTYIANGEKEELESGELAPGGEVSGKIYFAVAKDAKSVKLLHENMFSKKSDFDFILK